MRYLRSFGTVSDAAEESRCTAEDRVQSEADHEQSAGPEALAERLEKEEVRKRDEDRWHADYHLDESCVGVREVLADESQSRGYCSSGHDCQE